MAPLQNWIQNPFPPSPAYIAKMVSGHLPCPSLVAPFQNLASAPSSLFPEPANTARMATSPASQLVSLYSLYGRWVMCVSLWFLPFFFCFQESSVPYPRTSGARFCGNSFLVCFGRPAYRMKVRNQVQVHSLMLAFTMLDLTLKRKLRNKVHFSRFILYFVTLDLTLK